MKKVVLLLIVIVFVFWLSKNDSIQDIYYSLVETDANKECNIKGNISAEGEKIYHMVGGQFYAITIAEEMFCSEDEANDAGFRKSQR